MLNRVNRYGRVLGCAAAITLLGAWAAGAQEPSAPARAASEQLMQRDLIGLPNKEVLVTRIDQPPGASSKPHRHDAQVFVYVLQGKVKMQVKGGPLLTLGPGQMFYEGPEDIHAVSANASSTEPAKFLVFMIKDKGKPVTRTVTLQ